MNHCRAKVIRHGYQATIRATVNYNAIAACDISVVEQAVLATITEMFARAAAMRAANRGVVRRRRAGARLAPSRGRPKAMLMTIAEHPGMPSVDAAVAAGLRWLYDTVQPPTALIDRRGAELHAGNRTVRLVPISSSGTPLIVVDIVNVHWGPHPTSPPLNGLPLDELPSLTTELAALGIASTAHHYHATTGTIALEVPAHASLLAAVHRYARGCPSHRGPLCDASARIGGHGCTWRTDGSRAAIWPQLVPDSERSGQ